jgi:hypothetical protein
MTDQRREAVRDTKKGAPLDHTDCELVVLAEFLQRRGLLEEVDIDQINTLVGRAPRELDIKAYSMQLMLRFGCDRIIIADEDLLATADTFEQWLDLIAPYDEFAADTRKYRRAYPQAQELVRNTDALTVANLDRFHHERRPATHDDLERLLADERVVLIGEQRSIPGYFWPVAVSGIIAPGRYRGFDMDEGEVIVSSEVFTRVDGTLALFGWRSPRRPAKSRSRGHERPTGTRRDHAGCTAV